MKKWLVSFIILLTVLATIGLADETDYSEQNKKRVEDTIKKEMKLGRLQRFEVHLTSIALDGLGSCTGSVLSNKEDYSTVLTCKHCINTDLEYYAEDKKVEKIITRTGDDLAYLIVEGKFKNKDEIKLAKEKAPINSTISLFGKPGFVLTFEDSGQVKFYSERWGFVNLTAISGCSGAGLFNEDEELIGVLWGHYTEGGMSFFGIGMGGADISIFTPLDRILKFLKNIEGNENFNQAILDEDFKTFN
jgi:hypothetical protein